MAGPPRRPLAATPVERVRDEHPDSEAWRADGLAGSRHSRLLDELRLPLDDPDPERAADVVGEVTRRALRDLAPALVLLGGERRRAQALAGYALTLFDFAAQTGLEGERLTQINRWEFDLELALDGRPPGQPVFVRMARAEGRRPWPRPALDELGALARRRAVVRRPATPEAAAEDAARLGRALVEALSGETAAPAAVRLAAGVVRLRGLLDLGEDRRRGREALAASALPAGWQERPDAAEALARAVATECAAVGELLADAAGAAALPAELRPAGRFLRLAARRLLRGVEAAGARVAEAPPRLGAWARLALLARARWGR